MEDRYLCKAKRTDNGEWVIGGLVRYGFTEREKYYIVPSYASDLYALEIDPSTICWCTGLKDKNGKLIWENDIVELVLGSGEVRYFKVLYKRVIRKVICHPDFDDDVAKVELNAICFEWNEYELFPCIDEYGISDVRKMEIVGNVFTNPELLEVQE